MHSFLFWLGVIANVITVGTAVYLLHQRLKRWLRRRRQLIK